MFHRQVLPFCVALVPIAAASSQSVLTVGINGQYADLPAAVAAAQPGDTVRCLQQPPFQIFTAPNVTRGITVDGVGAHQLRGPFVIAGIPAGELVVVRGFVSSIPFDIQISDCVGHVHLDELNTTTNASAAATTPSIAVLRSASVSCHRVSTYGAPAVQVEDSTLVLDDCKLGTVAGGNLGLGQTIRGLRSSILVSQPAFRAGLVPLPAVFVDQCAVTITGRTNATGGGSIFGGIVGVNQWLAVDGTNSTLVLSPNIVTQGGIGSGVAVTLRDTPFQRVDRAQPGLTVNLETFGAAGAFGVAVLSPATSPAPSPFGQQWVDLSNPIYYVFGLNQVGYHSLGLAVPLNAQVGAAWTLQSLVASGGRPELSLHTTFTIRP